MNWSHPRLIINLLSTSIDSSTLWLNNYLSAISFHDWVIILNNQLWSPPLLWLAHHLLGCQRSPPICYALVLGQQFWVSVFTEPSNSFSLDIFWYSPTHRSVRKYDPCAHIWPRMQMIPQASLRILTSADPRVVPLHPQQAAHTLPLHTCTRKHMRVCPPAHPALPHLTHETAWHLSQKGGVAHTHTHAHPRKHKHGPAVCSERTLLTLWQVHGRISKWGEKPLSRSTSQRCALSIGSCRTPQGSGGRRRLSQEAAALLSGSEVCLERYLHLSGWGAGGQEVRQEWDHLFHVLWMTCGVCFEYLHVSEGDANIVGRKREEVPGNCAFFVNKDRL